LPLTTRKQRITVRRLRCLSHRDALRLINAADDLLLVDFEYASNNERAYELALWFTEMAFPGEIEREM
jgi:thiamine kinase-like enzyme